MTTSDLTKVTPSVMPETNKSITFNIDGQGIVGAMTFQLFDNLTPGIASQIEALADAKVYNGDYIYRSDRRIRGAGRQYPAHDQQWASDGPERGQYSPFLSQHIDRGQ